MLECRFNHVLDGMGVENATINLAEDFQPLGIALHTFLRLLTLSFLRKLSDIEYLVVRVFVQRGCGGSLLFKPLSFELRNLCQGFLELLTRFRQFQGEVLQVIGHKALICTQQTNPSGE